MPTEKRSSLHGGGETDKTGDTTGHMARDRNVAIANFDLVGRERTRAKILNRNTVVSERALEALLCNED